MFNYGYTTEKAMHYAIARKLKTAVTVVRHLLENGNGEFTLNGFRVEVFYNQGMGFYFLMD